MVVEMNDPEELYKWYRQVFLIGGLWPLEPTYFTFYTFYTYNIVHMVLTFGDLIDVFGDVSLMVSNMFEATGQVMSAVKFLMMRHSSMLKEILEQVLADLHVKDYNDEVEMKLYMAYNTIGKVLFKTGSYLTVGCLLLYHLQPLEDILSAVLSNETIPFNMPYRMRLFFEIKDARIYAIVYLSQTPMIYLYYSSAMSFFLICTLILHVAGEMSVLAHRIRSIVSSELSIDCRGIWEITFRKIMKKHCKIINMVELIDNTFNLILLEEIILLTVMIGLIVYILLTNSSNVPMVDICFYVTCSTNFAAMVFAYCVAGEFLLQMSTEVQYAYYECKWYEMPSTFQKNFILCMARAQKPVLLTAGRFYILSLSKFTDILKTSMAYVSMLRTVT